MQYLPNPDRYTQPEFFARCGKSGLLLPRISLGLWHNFGDVDTFETARAIVLRAFDLGVTHFDLANNYGPPPGSAESNFGKMLASDLKSFRDELIISTKAGYTMWPGPYGDWGSRKYLLSSLDQSLKRMGLDYVDIFYSHRMDPSTPLEETMGALAHAVKSGTIVVDNSSAFRMDPKVPLVVPEINASDVATHSGILANPNCTTAITLMALYPLHRAFGLKKVIASSYQAVSGTGARAIEELRDQVEAIAAGNPVVKEVYPHQIAFNVLPHVDSFLEDGYTREEMKMQNEGRRIMHLPTFTASVTCVRVPVYRAHSVAVTAEFENAVSLEKARVVLDAAPGILLHDDPSKAIYPMPIECSGGDDCRVGRLRVDCALPNALSFWICGDQLLKGAALNAVQIAELL